MKKIIISSLALILTVGLLSACTNRELGTTTGAVVGGVAGNVLTGGSAAGTLVGAAAGGFVGNQVTK